MNPVRLCAIVAIVLTSIVALILLVPKTSSADVDYPTLLSEEGFAEVVDALGVKHVIYMSSPAGLQRLADREGERAAGMLAETQGCYYQRGLLADPYVVAKGSTISVIPPEGMPGPHFTVTC